MTFPAYDRTVSLFTQNKDFNNFFVKILPSNLDYKSNPIRRKKINGITYDLYLNQWMEYALYFGIANEDKSKLYHLIKPSMTVLDVGVNFGETLLNFANLAGPNGKVYGFEPMPYIFQKCLQNITFENIAISNNDESLIINDPLNGNSGGTYVSKTNNIENASQIIPAITIDNYVIEKGIGKIDLIKIDAEGFEYNIIAGSFKTLQNSKPVLYIELCDENLKRANSSSHELINILKKQNYLVRDALTKTEITEKNVYEYPHTDVIATPIS